MVIIFTMTMLFIVTEDDHSYKILMKQLWILKIEESKDVKKEGLRFQLIQKKQKELRIL